MLQQTQVDRVIPRWHAFLGRWPDPARCAATPVAEVIAAWVGLGYNRRAVNLWRCAHTVTTHHGGRFPRTLDGLLALPGVGAYTARAVLAFAYEADVAVVDTNVARVLARRAGRSLTAKEVQAAADAAVPAGGGWRWNQAMLDLGATVCRARTPDCPQCPVRCGCHWAEAGHPQPDPAQGSAGVSGRQSAFAGSDRQGRGRLVAALRHGPVAEPDLARVMGWPTDPARAKRVAATLVIDGLAEVSGDALVFPGARPADSSP
jgi:A/G-specific adenine glycosylase